MNALAAEGLVAKRGTALVLKGASLQLAPKRLVALIAPSGTGKSTLLRCLAGLDAFDEGRVLASGEILRSGGDRRANDVVRRRVGLVFQELYLFGHMTAIENVAEAPTSVLGNKREVSIKRARTLLDELGVGHRGEAFPDEMSGGERQRVAIARALAMKPEVLLLDEPTSALDHDRRGDLVRLLRTLADAGTAILMATHDAELARRSCDQVLQLAGGLIRPA